MTAIDSRCRRCWGEFGEHIAPCDEFPNGVCNCALIENPCPCPGYMDPADSIVQKVKPRVYAWLDRLFAHEAISGHGRREYLHRWVLIKRPTWSLYLHHFCASDWSFDTHDHPKEFTSIGIWGRYCDQDAFGNRQVFRAPWWRRFPPKHRHRILIAPGESAWTLVHVGRLQGEWGFWTNVSDNGLRYFRWVPWAQYVADDHNDLRIAPAFEEFDGDPK